MYKCKKCGFECASEKLLTQHKEREKTGLSEYQYKKKIQKEQKEIIDNYLIKEKYNNGN